MNNSQDEIINTSNITNDIINNNYLFFEVFIIFSFIFKEYLII